MFIEIAKTGRNNFWRYLVSILIIILATQLIGGIPLFIIITKGVLQTGSYSLPENPADFAAMGINPNLGMFAMLFPFIAGMVFMYICIRKIHERPFKSVLTSRPAFSWQRFWFGAGLWTLFQLISFIVHMVAEPGSYVFHADWIAFIPLVIVSILFIPFQAGFEEVLFRGYLMQGFALLFRNKWLPLLITGMSFGLLHAFNPEVQAFGFWIAMPQYVGLGLFFGLLVICDEGLEIVLGIHILNNIFLSLFLTTDSSALQTTALFRAKVINPVTDLVELFLFIILFIFIAQRKYRWNIWQSVVSGIQ